MDGKYVYEQIEVLSYRSDTEEFSIYWKKDKKHDKLKRIYLCFDAEDPRKYVERVKNAFAERVYADSIIRYEFFIDNMPLTNADLP